MQIIRPQSRQPIPANAKRVFEGVIFDVYQWEQELFDGRKATFEKLKRDDTVCVFATTPDRKLILLEQEQPGKQPFISLPGGRVEEGEDVFVGAKRELLEEVGAVSEDWSEYGSYQLMSKIDWTIFYLVARNCRITAEQNLDGGEKIRLKYVTFAEFIDHALSERFSDTEIVLDIYKAKLQPDGLALLEACIFGS